MKSPPNIMLRKTANKMVKKAAEEDGVLDCTELEFASGGVTDELLNSAHEEDVTLKVKSNSNVSKMIKAYEKIYEEHRKPSMEHTYEMVD